MQVNRESQSVTVCRTRQKVKIVVGWNRSEETPGTVLKRVIHTLSCELPGRSLADRGQEDALKVADVYTFDSKSVISPIYSGPSRTDET